MNQSSSASSRLVLIYAKNYAVLNAICGKLIDRECLNLRDGRDEYAVSASVALWPYSRWLITELNGLWCELIVKGDEILCRETWSRSTR